MLNDLRTGLEGYTIISDETILERDLILERLLPQDREVDVEYVNNGHIHEFTEIPIEDVRSFLSREFINSDRKSSRRYLNTRRVILQKGKSQLHHIHLYLGDIEVYIGSEIIKEEPYKEAILEYTVRTK